MTNRRLPNGRTTLTILPRNAEPLDREENIMKSHVQKSGKTEARMERDASLAGLSVSLSTPKICKDLRGCIASERKR